jgi:hypothetical protein
MLDLILYVSMSLSKVYVDDSLKSSSARVSDALSKAHAISFYFLDQSEKYAYNETRLKKEADLVIVRQCGANCLNYMEKILHHLSESKETKCPPGQENILIEINSETKIMYSYFGRISKINNKCFFNKVSVSTIIENTEFIFE